MLIDRLNNLVCRCLVGRETIHAVQTVLTLLQHCTVCTALQGILDAELLAQYVILCKIFRTSACKTPVVVIEPPQ